jgi:CRP-like cAMP-binding protein
MRSLPQSSGANSLLGALSKSDFDLLSSKFELSDLVMGQVLQEPNKQIEYAYFPSSGICSVIAENVERVQAETGLIGREGFVGVPIVLYADSSPSQVVVQAEGQALRLGRARLLGAIGRSPSLHAMLLRFAHTFNIQVSQTAVANGHYTINQRFLSVMLAVRRAGITEALTSLEGKKAIRALRGRVVVLNRSSLEEVAGAAYGIPEREYRRLITQF